MGIRYYPPYPREFWIDFSGQMIWLKKGILTLDLPRCQDFFVKFSRIEVLFGF